MFLRLQPSTLVVKQLQYQEHSLSRTVSSRFDSIHRKLCDSHDPQALLDDYAKMARVRGTARDVMYCMVSYPRTSEVPGRLQVLYTTLTMPKALHSLIGLHVYKAVPTHGLLLNRGRALAH